MTSRRRTAALGALLLLVAAAASAVVASWVQVGSDAPGDAGTSAAGAPLVAVPPAAQPVLSPIPRRGPRPRVHSAPPASEETQSGAALGEITASPETEAVVDPTPSGDANHAADGGGCAFCRAEELAFAKQPHWLRDHQSEDGSWRGDAFSARCRLNLCDGAGAAGRNVSSTGLALLSFLGAGETHQSGRFRETLKNGLKRLRDDQDDDGCFSDRGDARFLAEHAIGALAMSEAYASTGSRVFRGPAERGVAFAFASAAVPLPWRDDLRAGDPVDAEALPWLVLLLRSAELAEIDTHGASFAEVAAWFDDVTEFRTGRVALPGASAAEEDVLTAAGLLARVWAGRKPQDDARLLRAAESLVRILEEDPDGSRGSAVTRYFALSALWQMGGDTWRAGDATVKSQVIDRQRREEDRDERGSWDPSPADAALGRVGVTALNTLCLEIHYRYGRVLALRSADR